MKFKKVLGSDTYTAEKGGAIIQKDSDRGGWILYSDDNDGIQFKTLREAKEHARLSLDCTE